MSNTVIINIMTTFEFKSDECNLVAAPMAHGASMFMLPTLGTRRENIVSGTTKPEILADWIERFLRHMLGSCRRCFIRCSK